jgi:cytochrome c biogenesis protein CcmG/thiol:disulfide interchange protein DsbE
LRESSGSISKENDSVEKHKTKSKSLLIIVIGLWVGIFLGVAVIVGLVLSGKISLGDSNEPEYAPLAKLENGSLANDFELENLDGGKTRLSDLRGRVVVVNFWATWCIPCIEEMPMFESYSGRYPQFTLLGIDEQESKEKVNEHIEKMGITYPILLDYNAKVNDSYKVFILPTTFFIDEQGMIRFRHYGIMSQDQFTYYLRTLGVIE